jgi:predicted metalloprotease with PDZ domain
VVFGVNPPRIALGGVDVFLGKQADNEIIQWIGSPRIFDGEKLAKSLQDLYARMSDFFKDSETSYRIYARRRPFRGFGGSTFTRSFILEFSDGKAEEEIDEEELFYLLSHEMVHNWPRMEGPGKFIKEDEGTWFVEGMRSLLFGYILPSLSTSKTVLGGFSSVAHERI